MAGIWLPGYARVDLGWAGAPYDEMAHPKLLWHTTEGTSLAGARAAFRSYPPHIGYDPWTDVAEQYVPLNRHAYALAGAESDDEFVVQVEIVGFAGQSHTWPNHVLERLGRRVAAPIAAAVGVPAQHLRFRRADEGIVLASKNSPIRLSDAAFRAFSGHLGHQHAPAPDQHWDPGGLPIDQILAYAQGDDMTPEEVRRAVLDQPVNDAGNWTLADAVRALALGEAGKRPAGALAGAIAGAAAGVADLKARPPLDPAAVAADLTAPLLEALANAGIHGITPGMVAAAAEEGVRAAFERAGQNTEGQPV